MNELLPTATANRLATFHDQLTARGLPNPLVHELTSQLGRAVFNAATELLDDPEVNTPHLGE